MTKIADYIAANYPNDGVLMGFMSALGWDGWRHLVDELVSFGMDLSEWDLTNVRVSIDHSPLDAPHLTLDIEAIQKRIR